MNPSLDVADRISKFPNDMLFVGVKAISSLDGLLMGSWEGSVESTSCSSAIFYALLLGDGLVVVDVEKTVLVVVLWRWRNNLCRGEFHFAVPWPPFSLITIATVSIPSLLKISCAWP